MTDLEKEKVENYIKEHMVDGVIEGLSTIENPTKQQKAPKYLTQGMIVINEEAGLKQPITFNSLKLLREINKKEKYGKWNS